jgi:hypothetical protein
MLTQGVPKGGLCHARTADPDQSATCARRLVYANAVRATEEKFERLELKKPAT